MDDLVPTQTLAKQGVAAVGGIAGGIGLWVLNGLAHVPVVGIVAGAVVTVIGVVALRSEAPEDRRVGGVVTGAGVLSILSGIGIFGGLAGGLMGLASIGLIGLGAVNAWKFYKGLRSRR